MRKVLVVQPLHPEAMALLDARDDVEYTVLTDFSEPTLLAHIGGVEAITIRDAPLPGAVIEAADRLRVISRHGVGYNNVPIELCTRRGIPVTLVGAANAVSVAEQTMLLMLAAARVSIELDGAVRRGDFSARSRVLGVELRGRTLVLVGYGRIGREVVRLLRPWEMRVLVSQRSDPGDPDVDHVPLEALLERADVVVLACPLTPETHHLLDAARLALMKTGALLVNVARGPVVDQEALAAALAAGRLGGAGLDVFEREPVEAADPILAAPNTIVTPHALGYWDQLFRAKLDRAAARLVNDARGDRR